MSKNYVKVTEDEKKKAAEIHPVDYLEQKGVNLIRQGKYFVHETHDSLKIKDTGHWYWNSRNTGGFGAISLARELYNLSYQEAVKDVLGNTSGISVSELKMKNPNQNATYPAHYETKNTSEMYDYLVNERKLNPKMVKFLHDRGLIVQDKMKNVVFKWYNDQNELIGANVQGTQKMANGGYFKHVMPFSSEVGSFKFDIGVPKKIAFFESVIDAASYVELNKVKDIRIVSLNGVKNEAFNQALRDYSKYIKENNIDFEGIIIGVDNDKAGKVFIEHIKSFMDSSILDIQIPRNKDFNEDLKEKVNVKQNINENTNEKLSNENQTKEIERG